MPDGAAFAAGARVGATLPGCAARLSCAGWRLSRTDDGADLIIFIGRIMSLSS
jgi:hypothetical protein